jgi:hypothetical protein
MVWLNHVDCPRSKFDGQFIAYYEWIDSRLMWNTSEFEFANITVPVKKIWFPQVRFQNVNLDGENGELNEGMVFFIIFNLHSTFLNLQQYTVMEEYGFSRHFTYVLFFCVSYMSEILTQNGENLQNLL